MPIDITRCGSNWLSEPAASASRPSSYPKQNLSVRGDVLISNVSAGWPPVIWTSGYLRLFLPEVEAPSLRLKRSTDVEITSDTGLSLLSKDLPPCFTSAVYWAALSGGEEGAGIDGDIRGGGLGISMIDVKCLRRSIPIPIIPQLQLQGIRKHTLQIPYEPHQEQIRRINPFL